jgi:hypothetical protein
MVYKNGALKIIFGPKRDKVTGAEENIVRSSTGLICTLPQIIIG